MSKNDMKAVILAGGLGSRLKPFTDIIPKPLLPVGESSVLEIQVNSLARCGVCEIYIATNYRADYVEAFLGDGSKYGVQLKYSKEEKRLGTCGPVGLLREELTDPFILMNGDVLTNADFSSVYENALKIDAELVVITKEIVTPFHFGRVISDGDFVTDVEEKPDVGMEILAGIYVMRPAVFAHIPPDVFYGMDTLIRDMLSQGKKVGRHLLNSYWLDVGQIQDYQQAEDAYRTHFSDLKQDSADA
jgi:NDP-sugar pyrophosphorylase family protein